MNKKNLFVILALMTFCVMSFSACADGEEGDELPGNSAAANNYAAKADDTVVTGEVTRIVGNRVTLALGNLSADSSQESADVPQSDGAAPTDLGEFPGEPPADLEGFEGFEGFDGGQMPEMGGEAPEMPQGGRGGRGNVTIEKTGEESEYIIPVGMPVDGLSGRSSDYSGITEGTVLTLTVNANGVVCAASAAE